MTRGCTTQPDKAPVVLVIPSYTGLVKTAISLPAETYERATRMARELGLSRSAFFSRAAERYLQQLQDSALTREVNEALETLGPLDESTRQAIEQGRRRLATIDGDW